MLVSPDHQDNMFAFSLMSSWTVHFLQSSYVGLWECIHSCNHFSFFNLTYSRIDLYLVYSSLNFNIWIDSCNHYHDQETEQSRHPQKTSLSYPLVVTPSPISYLGHHWSVFYTIILSFPECHINGIIQFIAFLAPYNNAFWDSSLLLHVLVIHSFLLPSCIPLYKYMAVCLSIHQSMNIYIQFLVIMNNAAVNICKLVCV